MRDEVRREIGQAWSFRARVEREAAARFARLAEAISAFDPASPVPALMRRAAADEDRHAALCAGLAELYGESDGADAGDVPIAPRTLAARDAVLYEVVAACCITETESVATLATLLGEAADARIRAAVREIARDEVVHGRMGWAHLAREAAARDVSFLARWIPTMLSGSVDDSTFAAAEASGDSEELLRHGVLPRSRKREIFLRTLEEVVLPGLEQFGIDLAPARGWLASREQR